MIKKIILPLCIITILLAGCGAGNQKKNDAAYQQMTMDEAKEWMETASDFTLVDVRTSQEYSEGHIPNAINIPNETITDEELSELPDKRAQILIYCRSGNRSRQAAEKLADLGYTNIIEIGGINSWQGDIVREQ